MASYSTHCRRRMSSCKGAVTLSYDSTGLGHLSATAGPTAGAKQLIRRSTMIEQCKRRWYAYLGAYCQKLQQRLRQMDQQQRGDRNTNIPGPPSTNSILFIRIRGSSASIYSSTMNLANRRAGIRHQSRQNCGPLPRILGYSRAIGPLRILKAILQPLCNIPNSQMQRSSIGIFNKASPCGFSKESTVFAIVLSQIHFAAYNCLRLNVCSGLFIIAKTIIATSPRSDESGMLHSS